MTDLDLANETSAAADAVVEKVFASVLGGMEVLSIALGDRLGFYTLLAQGPLTPDDLAAQAGTDARWTREWLEQQAVVGYLTVTDGRFALAPGVAETLAQPEALTTMAPAARMIAAAAAQWTRIADAARTGAGLGWREYGPDMFESQADQNRPQLEQLLPDSWLAQALPDVHRRLEAGEPLLVADVGCGGGWASIGLARRWPSATVHAYDVDGPSVELARSNVERAGLADRVTVHEQDVAAEQPGQTYDLALAVECIHDMPRPVPVLAAMREMVGEDGHVLVVDEKVADEFTPPGDEVEQLMYGFSILICLPDGMSGADSAATGTVIRRSTMQRYAREAGFADAEVLPVEHDLWRFYALTR
jgi:SAM-dependent methyltransferase